MRGQQADSDKSSDERFDFFEKPMIFPPRKILASAAIPKSASGDLGIAESI